MPSRSLAFLAADFVLAMTLRALPVARAAAQGVVGDGRGSALAHIDGGIAGPMAIVGMLLRPAAGLGRNGELP